MRIILAFALTLMILPFTGCNEIEENPRTAGTIGGAAAGAAIGASVDDDDPARGAVIGGAVGAGAGNAGGKVYKDNNP